MAHCFSAGEDEVTIADEEEGEWLRAPFEVEENRRRARAVESEPRLSSVTTETRDKAASGDAGETGVEGPSDEAGESSALPGEERRLSEPTAPQRCKCCAWWYVL